VKRILVCGGRDYGVVDPKKPEEAERRALERSYLRIVLKGFVAKMGRVLIISGAASGADSLAAEWAKDNHPTYSDLVELPLMFPADWNNIDRPGAVVKVNRAGKKYDALAGFVRNQKMIDEGRPDLVVAFPGGRGTADMIRRARDAGIEVLEIF